MQTIDCNSFDHIKGTIKMDAPLIPLTAITRIYNKEREESVKRTIWPVQDVFGKSHTRNSNIDQPERSIQIANYGRGLEC